MFVGENECAVISSQYIYEQLKHWQATECKIWKEMKGHRMRTDNMLQLGGGKVLVLIDFLFM